MRWFDLETGKIVGSSNTRFWTQTHIFFPQDEKKELEFGILLAAFSVEAKEEKTDLIAFGKEIIARFHEIYYSEKTSSVFLKLKKSLEKLENEFEEKVKIEAAVGVILPVISEKKIVGYFASLGEGKIFLVREKQMVGILKGGEEIKTVSGFLNPGDWFILGTQQFFQLVSSETIRLVAENKKIEEGQEILSAKVHGYPQNSQSAAIFFKIQPSKKREVGDHFLKKTILKIKKGKQKLKDFLNPFRTKDNLTFFSQFPWQEFKIKDEEKRRQARKTTLLVAIILIFLLGASVFFGFKRKESRNQSKALTDLIFRLNSQYEEAVSLKESNPLKSRLLLKDSLKLIKEEEEKLKNKQEKDKLKEWLKKIEGELEKISHEYHQEGEVFLDLTLIKEEFKGSNWAADKENLYILDKEKGLIIGVRVKNKAAKIVAGGEKIKGGKIIGASGGRIFIAKEEGILVIDEEKGELVKELKKEWQDLQDLVGFAGNIYLLDKKEGQIWKYRQPENANAKKTAYLENKTDFNNAVSLAIDGAVWVLTSEGEILKFMQGKPVLFILGSLETPLSEPNQVEARENNENLYVLDKKNTRIVVFSKETGEYKGAYLWGGIAGAYKIAVFEEEKKILLLTGARIYQLTLKEKD